jgi:hypothetical protein
VGRGEGRRRGEKEEGGIERKQEEGGEKVWCGVRGIRGINQGKG